MEATETIGVDEAVAPQPKTEKKFRDWKGLVNRISYQGIVRNTPYLMFLTLLSILYITNNNKAITLTRSINEKTKELKELKWKHMDLQSRLMYQTSESQLIKKTEMMGLKPLDRPAFEIKETIHLDKKNK